MALTKSQIKLNHGSKAPDFRLKGIDDKIHSLDEFSDAEGLLLIFMCNHCPYVKAKLPAIIELYKKFAGRVGFIGINSNDPVYPGEGMENMKAFAAEQGIEFAYVLDDTQEIAKAYGATCTPDPFLFEASTGSTSTRSKGERVDKERKLVFHGRINDALEPGDRAVEHTMEITIQKMLNGEVLDQEFKPSMGCSIKWIDS